VLWFFALAYALSWAWWVPLALGQPVVQRGDGWPTHVPGLLGPMLAAFLVLALTEGSRGVRELLAAMVRWPHRLRWQVAVVSPLIFLVLALPVAAVLGGFPSLEEFGRFSGAAAGVFGVGFVMLINGYGEETGWRGYALPRLQARFGALRATVYVTLGWAGWHLPLFFALASYADFGPLAAIGFLVGLTAGAFVLTAIYNGSGGSVLAVAVWHALYNLCAATAAGEGAVSAVVTGCVIFWAVSLIQRERAGIPALGEDAPAAATR
jgi:membrane protease YdiL (CAAX protease family)